MDTKNNLKRLVKHRKWVWVAGLKCFPDFKEDQKVRFSTIPSEGWIPDLSDPVTLAYLHHLYVLNGGSVKRVGKAWSSSHEVEGEDLAQVLLASFLNLS